MKENVIITLNEEKFQEVELIKNRKQMEQLTTSEEVWDYS